MDTSTLRAAKLILCLIAHWCLPLVVSAQLPGSSKIDQVLSLAARITGPSDLMIIKDGAVVYNRNFGIQQGGLKKVPVSASSMWLASATLLALVDEGMLQLDEPVGNFLPQFKSEKAAITLRQLLSHTSGLPVSTPYLKDKNLSLAKLVDSIAIRTTLTAEPGTQFQYGSVSYQVAARLAEEASGKDWETLFREKIGTPCKMPNTDFGNQRSKNIADGAYSTSDDYSNFLQMILNRGIFQGVRVLSANSIHEMISDQTKAMVTGFTPYRQDSERKPSFYGFGVWIDRILPGDGTATEISCQGNNGFTPWVNFCKRLVGVYSFNDILNDVAPTIEETKRIIDEAFKDNCNDVSSGRGRKDDSSMSVSFRLETDAVVSLKLFDPLGNEVLVMMRGNAKAGNYSIPIDASKLNAGVYFYRLDVNGRVETKKITIKK